MYSAACIGLMVTVVSGLENGVARTPPMGFISWQRFENDVDCVNHPKTCISEDLYVEIA
jgi:alpha-N-acetylgalactosaminidase